MTQAQWPPNRPASGTFAAQEYPSPAKLNTYVQQPMECVYGDTSWNAFDWSLIVAGSSNTGTHPNLQPGWRVSNGICYLRGEIILPAGLAAGSWLLDLTQPHYGVTVPPPISDGFYSAFDGNGGGTMYVFCQANPFHFQSGLANMAFWNMGATCWPITVA